MIAEVLIMGLIKVELFFNVQKQDVSNNWDKQNDI